jgi:ABC-2 type transport system permease protein
MAELAPEQPRRAFEEQPLARPPAGRWTGAQTRAQFAAIAWLRWRILANSFRRKGGAGELIGQVFLWLMFGSLALVLVGGAGAVAYFLALHGRLDRIAWVLWAIFVLCQLLNIQLGQTATTFDPTQLIRFPLRRNTYVAIRLFFGLLTPANVAGTLMSLAVAVGIGAAVPALWVYAMVALAVFAATNVLFSRMIFAWVDRWLSTRRAREIFTGVMLAGSLGIQWANFTFNPAYNHGHRAQAYGISPRQAQFVTHLYARAQPWLAVMPPELASTSLVQAKQADAASFAGYTLAAALYGGLFLLVFALRMRTEFAGESLSDAAGGGPRKTATAKTAKPAASSAAVAPVAAVAGGFEGAAGSRVSAVVVTVLGKEILYVRRHMGILYALVMPIFLVLIFASRFAARSSSIWIFPGAVAYTLLAIAPLSYNSFGYEAAGSQLYFLAPVRMRDVLLAKNLMGFGMALVEVGLIFAIITYMTGLPSPQTAVAALLWAVGTLAINAIFGNRRSLSTPKKVNVQRMATKQTSQLSAFIALGVLMASAVVAAGLFGLCLWLHQMWALVPIFAVFAAMGVGLYVQSLGSVDRYAMEHREELFLELCKQN